jgi:hypothetical protein
LCPGQTKGFAVSPVPSAPVTHNPIISKGIPAIVSKYQMPFLNIDSREDPLVKIVTKIPEKPTKNLEDRISEEFAGKK